MDGVGENAESGCPACRGTLKPTESKWHVRACNLCGGVWTDTEAARRIVTAVDRELVGLAKEAATHAHDSVATAPAGTPRPCPVCQKPLQEVRAARVNVDVCAEHGTWFDRDELGRLSRNLEYQRTSTPPPQIDYRTSAAPSDAAGGTELLLALLGPEPQRR